MTVITETRWKCDWCGTVSPVIVFGNPPDLATGWKTYFVRKLEKQYIAATLIYHRVTIDTTYHFCCKAHKQAWLEEREKVDA